MVSLQEINPDNFPAISDLKITDEQKNYVGSADWIIALAYAHRSRNAHVLAISLGDVPIGLVMTSEFIFDNEPGFYYIDQIFIDTAHQQHGYGRQAMNLIIEMFKRERRYDMIMLDVDKAATPAIHLYKNLGFTQSSYADPDNKELIFFEFKI